MRNATPDEYADRERDYRKHDSLPSDRGQLYAVASLIGECESLVASGRLTQPAEQSLRLLIAQALAAFGMPSKAERAKVSA